MFALYRLLLLILPRSNFFYFIDSNGYIIKNTPTKKYFALLFPTHYEGEGFAGTLIDAYSAGVPVIASEWKYNSEVVNGDVGYIYSTGNHTEFVALLREIAENPTMLLGKKRNCLMEAEKYKVDKAIMILIDHLN